MTNKKINLNQVSEVLGISDSELMNKLKISRDTFYRMKKGKRNPSLSDIDVLTELLNCTPEDLVSGAFMRNTGSLSLGDMLSSSINTSSNNVMARQAKRNEDIGKSIKFNTIKALEELCDLHRLKKEKLSNIRYNYPNPKTMSDSISQGKDIAQRLRAELKLGIAPISSFRQIIKDLNIICVEAELNDSDDNPVSGMICRFMGDLNVIILNQEHHFNRKRFSLAHELCHYLVDFNESEEILHKSETSKNTNKNNDLYLIETRANVFASNFLLPEDGIRDYLNKVGKATESSTYDVYVDEKSVLSNNNKMNSHEVRIDAHDIYELSRTYILSPLATAYRLGNLRFIPKDKVQSMVDGVRALIKLMKEIPESKNSGGGLEGFNCSEEKGRYSEMNSVYDEIILTSIQLYKDDQISGERVLETAESIGGDSLKKAIKEYLRKFI